MTARPPTCDLHSHSLWSDGTESPAQVVEHALARELSALALTDHDTLEGIPEARSRAQGTSLRIISGVELSSAEHGAEVHVLGYFLDENLDELTAALARFREVRRERARLMLERLSSLGMPLSEEDVFARAKGGTVGRPHVAEALVAQGHCATLDEAFRRFLGNHGPAWVPKPVLTPVEAVGLVRRAGGAAVVAHPATIGRDSLIADLAKQGLAGLECIHPKHDPSTTERYRDMARRLGLVPTGGSDCHGRRPGGSMIGYGDVPLSVVDELEEAARSVRGA
ncbi:MAG TPA: PHP domain-containing protein [Candidatus Eisenbacteria bacterium]|nr:PHP domain-containing protein [Candidatus Eisenbacteria bacterium]